MGITVNAPSVVPTSTSLANPESALRAWSIRLIWIIWRLPYRSNCVVAKRITPNHVNTIPIAAIAMKALSSVITLKEVSLLDLAPFVVAAAVALGATALAAWQPARRATRVDPSETRRAEA